MIARHGVVISAPDFTAVCVLVDPLFIKLEAFFFESAFITCYSYVVKRQDARGPCGTPN